MNVAANTNSGKAMKTTTVTVWDIKDRDCTRFGVKHEGQTLKGQNAEITAGVSIRLFGTKGNIYVRDEAGKMVAGSREFDLTFRVGDSAVYGSYNYIYTGEITSIGEKTVTIQEEGGKAHRLSIYEFCSRNWSFDAERIADRNFDTMMTI